MNRDYINWLESLPCNRKRIKVNEWMSGYAPLPEEIDLPHFEEVQQEWIRRDAPEGVMARIRRFINK